MSARKGRSFFSLHSPLQAASLPFQAYLSALLFSLSAPFAHWLASLHKIIDSLLEYSKSLDADFTEAVKKKAEELRKMNEAYEEEARETERIINYWCEQIHANYNTRGRTTYYVDGKPTHRSPKPVPVIMRRDPWTGCGASTVLKDFFARLDG